VLNLVVASVQVLQELLELVLALLVEPVLALLVVVLALLELVCLLRRKAYCLVPPFERIHFLVELVVVGTHLEVVKLVASVEYLYMVQMQLVVPV
jgi:hypothetical protein